MSKANSNKAAGKKAFKTELAALEYFKARGVARLSSEYSLPLGREISIEAAILEARNSVRGANPLRLTTWYTTGVAKLVLSDAAGNAVYIEVWESANERAKKDEEERQYEEMKRVEQTNVHIRAKITEGQNAISALRALSRGEQMEFVTGRDRRGNQMRVGLIGLWMAHGGFVMREDSKVFLVEDWIADIRRTDDVYLRLLVDDVRRAQDRAMEQREGRLAAYQASPNVWFPKEEPAA